MINDLIFLECTEKDYCTGFPFCAESELLKERMQDECPIACKAEKCRDKWIESVQPAGTNTVTGSSADGTDGIMTIMKCILRHLELAFYFIYR